MKNIILITLITLITACASYEFGDVSRVYCGSTSSEFRAQTKEILTNKDVKTDVNYCVDHGLVDALVLSKNKKDKG